MCFKWIFIKHYSSTTRNQAMDILELLKEKILKDFPDITEEELRERIKIGEELLKALS